MLSNIRYVLLTATRDRLFFGLLVSVVAAAYISHMLGSTALLEAEQMSLAFTAASSRVIIMIGLIVFIGFHMKNAFDAREIDVLLSRPISRTTLVLSYWLGFATVALLLVVPTVVLVAIIGTINHTGFLLWSLSLLLEALLVVSLALFAALTIKSGVGTVLASLAMYTLSRMMGFFVVTTQSQLAFHSAQVNLGARWIMTGISTVIPRLDFYAKSQWLIYGAKSYDDLTLFLLQSAIFIPLLIAASVIDFNVSSSSMRATASSYAMQKVILVFVLLLGLQGAFWYHSHQVTPELEIVPDVPGERTVRALSFGDEEVFFRLYALQLQNSGDTFGRFTALYKYDYHKLHDWFVLLDKLNNRSNYLPALATYYFSQTQNPADESYIVDYLDEHTKDRVPEKWWWIVQGVYIAQHKLGDLTRAQELANRLAGVRSIPVWAQQMPAFIHEQRGEFGDALAIMEAVLKHPEDYSEGELHFMRYFIDERLGRLDAVKKELGEIEREKAEAKAKGAKDPGIQGPPADVGAIPLGLPTN